MRIVITSATEKETLAAKEAMANHPLKDHGLVFHYSGVGMLASAVSLTRMVHDQRPGLVIQAGIAGCFNENAALAEVVAVGDEQLADTGVLENGGWKDLFDLGFDHENARPFLNRRLPNPWLNDLIKNLPGIRTVSGVTVNQVSTNQEAIARIREKYDPFTESMEGAALHYVCLTANVPFLQLRSLSNYTGERDKAKWLIAPAVESLNRTLVGFLKVL